VLGGHGDDALFGAFGNDTLDGGGGDDALDGDLPNPPFVDPNPNTDTCDGNVGTDTRPLRSHEQRAVAAPNIRRSRGILRWQVRFTCSYTF
jgi:Ca2+-binding RTX toxin-like protein